MKKLPFNYLYLLAFLFVSSTANAAVLDYFPTKSWKTQSLEEAGFDKQAFQKFLDFAWEDKGRHRTDSVVIIKDGYLVYEGYTNGYTRDKRHMFWSFSKSLTGILMGIAIQKNYVTLDTKVGKYYPAVNKSGGSELTLRHVLNMSSGFKYYEENPVNIALSDSVYVYYSKKNFKDVAANIAKRKFKHAPGIQFNYGTHEPTLAMGVLKKAMNDQEAYDDFPWVELFDKLGMKSIAFEQDKSGTFLGGSAGWGSPLDYAKLGLLILNDGVWDGERILPEGYVDWATKQIAPSLLTPKKESKEQRLNREAYGGTFWLNKKLPMNKNGRPYPSAPEDLIQAMGFRGQTMGVFPSLNMVVVRMGSDDRNPKRKLKRDKFYKYLLDSLKGVK